MLYAIHAVGRRKVIRSGEEFTATKQVPTFFLDSNIQGITSADHAQRIAINMLGELAPDTSFDVSAFAHASVIDRF